MKQLPKFAIFEGKKIRRLWDDSKELWYFSVVDVVQVLTNQSDFTTARKYWNKLAERLRVEGSEVVTKCHQLKMLAADGKMRLTDAADTEVMLRIIQAYPLPTPNPSSSGSLASDTNGWKRPLIRNLLSIGP